MPRGGAEDGEADDFIYRTWRSKVKSESLSGLRQAYFILEMVHSGPPMMMMMGTKIR